MFLALLATLACAPATWAPPAAATPFVGAHEAPADVTGLEKQTSPTGLSWYVLKEGVGLVTESGRPVKVHYVGFLAADGRRFDSSYDRGKPLSFPVGTGRVIRGWDEGIVGMKVGEQRQLHVPAKLGYGSRGAGGLIPPDADLVFDVELVALY